MAFSKLAIFQKAQWFLRFNGPLLEVNDDVIEELRTIQSHLVVVSAVGSYRTGKSWILNRLAKCTDGNGFAVADGQSSVTNGVWMLCREHPVKDNCILVFLDTGGLHDPTKEDAVNEDNRLFIVTFLLSSTLIYNVFHKLDDNDLQKIGFVTQISEKLQKTDARKLYPEFLLLIRDVPKLKLDGSIVKPDEYLERIITSGVGGDRKLSTKTCIYENFRTRHCFTLTQPVAFEDLGEMGETKNPLLKPEYVQDEDKLREYLYLKADLKRLHTGSACSTKVFCTMLPEIVKVVQDGCIPTIPSIQQRIAKEENERVIEEVRHRFAESLRNNASDDLYGSFKEKYSVLKTNGLQHLERSLVPEYEGHLTEVVQGFNTFTVEQYHSVVRARCLQEVAVCLEAIKDKVNDNRYRPPEAETRFKRDIENAKQQYFKRVPFDLGPEREDVWKEKEKEIAMYLDRVIARDIEWQMRQSQQKTRELEEQCQAIRKDAEHARLDFQRKEKELQDKQRDQELQIQSLIAELKEEQRKTLESQRQIAEQQSQAANSILAASLFSGIAEVGVATIRALASIEDDDD